MGFLSGPVAQNGKGFGAKTKQFFGNMFDRNNDGKSTFGEKLRTGLGFLSPVGFASNLARAGYNQYRDYHPVNGQPNQWNHAGMMPDRPNLTGQFYGTGGDVNQNFNIPQSGLSGGDMNYTGGSATFNERTGNYATPPQGNGFLSGYNPTANQYRGIQMNQQRNDNMAGYLNSANGANPFSHMNPGDMALSNHNNHAQYMNSQRFMGDMNPSNAQAEFDDQNKARYDAAMMYK